MCSLCPTVITIKFSRGTISSTSSTRHLWDPCFFCSRTNSLEFTARLSEGSSCRLRTIQAGLEDVSVRWTLEAIAHQSYVIALYKSTFTLHYILLRCYWAYLSHPAIQQTCRVFCVEHFHSDILAKPNQQQAQIKSVIYSADVHLLLIIIVTVRHFCHYIVDSLCLNTHRTANAQSASQENRQCNYRPTVYKHTKA